MQGENVVASGQLILYLKHYNIIKRLPLGHLPAKVYDKQYKDSQKQ
jgi:hypothetical protein